ncbi:MAG: hypothetical protein MJ178_07235 [Treponemataceae bacterium]|nr:hypothetical protein [Treponemataceae bacterium]
MKKSPLILYLLCAVLLFSCASTPKNTPAAAPANPYQMSDFPPYPLEFMGDFLGCNNNFSQWEEGSLSVSPEDFPLLYENYSGEDLFSMMAQNFFRQTDNPGIQQSLLNLLLQKNQLSDYETALLKKLTADKKVRTTNDGEYVYYVNGEEYDENIDLFHFFEWHPFQDEYGIMMFDNNWNVISADTGREMGPFTNNALFAICGGGTNSMSISITEVSGVTPENLYDAMDRLTMYERHMYPDTWEIEEFPKTGVFSICDADRFFVGRGYGPDINVPAIDTNTCVSYIYSESRQKLYATSFFMNFSKINMNYDIREQLFSYLDQFAFFCFVD